MIVELPDQKAEEFRALCCAIGFVVVNWALIEQQIDNLVNISFDECGGRNLRKNGDIPRSLSQKIRFLKDCFKKQSALSSFANEGFKLLKRVEQLSDERHNLVHGTVTSMETVEGAFQFQKIGYETEAHTLSSFSFHPDDFSRLGELLGDLLTELIVFSQKLADEFFGDRSQSH